ncbi:MAG TPA: LanC-like protein [Gaiellaceae bacterium]|nr:LanC-like protein [Gaiellaceae bacterium]
MSDERVAAIVAEAEAALDGVTWPSHELDAPVTPQDELTLYLGAAGMIWALRRLGSSLDLDALAADALRRFRALEQPETPASLLVGETGLLVLTRADDDRLRDLVRANERCATWELLWGSPGTILAARAAGLDDEARRSAGILAEEWERSDGLWTQELRDQRRQFLGPAHGFAGNVHALRGFLDDDELRRRIEPVLREHAVWDGDTVNWPPVPGHPLDRVQWCHGAPGIVATLGDLLPEDLLLAGAETTWRAGPLEKGPGLCHGTAGNGYALLKTYVLTGDELWLERARSFADAALSQLQSRYSLFTGDIGAALFAQACLDVDARFPIMDVL